MSYVQRAANPLGPPRLCVSFVGACIWPWGVNVCRCAVRVRRLGLTGPSSLGSSCPSRLQAGAETAAGLEAGMAEGMECVGAEGAREKVRGRRQKRRARCIHMSSGPSAIEA